mmetsp:Transcript_16699/g.34830  ORF Transcript_16699/g.34830 Transcript_16699/m.34830 type:complete len:322 (+) Transcript_16699:123-1088(+)
MPPHVESLSNHDDDVIHPSPSTVVDNDHHDDDDISSPNANSNANPNDANAHRSAGAVAPTMPQSPEYPSPLFRDEDELFPANHHLGGTSSRCRLDRRQSNGTNDGDIDIEIDDEERRAVPTKATAAAPPVFVSKISQILGPESKYIPSAPPASPCPSNTAMASGNDSRVDSSETTSAAAAETDRAAAVGQQTLAAFALGRTSSKSCNGENSKNDVSTGEEPSEAKGENEAPKSIVSAATTGAPNEEKHDRDECDDSHDDDHTNGIKNCTVEFLVLPPQLVLRATKTASKRGWKAVKFIGGSGTRLVGTVFAAGLGGGRSEC